MGFRPALIARLTLALSVLLVINSSYTVRQALPRTFLVFLARGRDALVAQFRHEFRDPH